jgi:diguanylate cyclase (GGDEF)-like protein
MAIFLRIDINLFAMLMLFMVFLIAIRRLDQKDALNRAYLMTLAVVFFQLGIEAITCILNGRPEIEWRLLSQFFHVILFSVAPLLSAIWYLLVRNFVTSRKKTTTIQNVFIFVPVILNAVLSLLSPFFGLYFSINSLGVYERGILFHLSIGITYIYFIVSIIHIIYYRHKLILNELVLLIVFNIIPIVGALFQALFYGLLLAWSSAGFALVIVYIYLQERLVHLDIMTGAWTRRSFDYFMDKRLKQKSVEPFGGIFFDIDHLKVINDQFGHAEGDQAIIEIVSRIKGLIKSSEFIARLGGDEFIIITDDHNIERLKSLVQDIQLSLAVFNENSNKGYELSCSYGYGLYSQEFKSIDQFLRFIDHRMYETKHHDLLKQEDKS